MGRLVGGLACLILIGVGIVGQFNSPNRTVRTFSDVPNPGSSLAANGPSPAVTKDEFSTEYAAATSLYVNREQVNVRSGPGTDHEIVDEIGLGHELVVIADHGNWLEVGVARRGGLIAYIWEPLVTATFPGGGTMAATDPKFDEFVVAVNLINESVRGTTGYDFFQKVENMGDGIVNVTAVDVWLSAPYENRVSNLNTLFDLWDAADGSGLPIVVNIVDSSGKIVMTRGRTP